jgi:hypothetical protein
MFFLLLVLFVYLLNITILFQGQSLILLVAFWILCILVKKAHTSMESTTFQVEVLEWVETMQFLVLLKAWYLFSIRLVNIKFYNFYKFVHLLRHELNEIMEEFFSILHKLYMRQIQWNALWNLERLLYKKNNLKIRSFDLRYLLNIQA